MDSYFLKNGMKWEKVFKKIEMVNRLEYNGKIKIFKEVN